ncbi:Rrf2 family transcriptional regulator [Streptomyces sp. SID6673]|nr:Rrf2 family transcriptional regulator [Streptomyces sp. SID11726]NEB26129.1 Rrf2 family transcriptional regulator [Streptomyces sp. SID6673]
MSSPNQDVDEYHPETNCRGTILVLSGRGENPTTYRRLGTRLAADGYRVVVPAASDARTLAEVVGSAESPLILIGHDAGAVAAWGLALTQQVDALVISGAPTGPADDSALDDNELDMRTACPVHRSRLQDDPDFEWGTLRQAAPDFPAGAPVIPTLFVHGGADVVADAGAIMRLADRIPGAEVAVFDDGRHDILNDKMHHSVAARIVIFIEKFCKGNTFTDSTETRAVSSEPSNTGPRSRRTAPVHISARISYALEALVEIADDPVSPVKCEEIAYRRTLPLNSLVNIMPQLRRAGLVSSQRGCDGGYLLGRPAADISVADVVRALEGGLVSTSLVDDSRHPVWSGLELDVTAALENWTIYALRHALVAAEEIPK